MEGRRKVTVAKMGSSSSDSAPPHLSSLQFLNAITVENDASQKGLLYAMVKVNGKEVLAMLDTGATNNFVAEREAKRLGLKAVQNSFKLNVVNSEARPVKGTIMVDLKIGE